MVYTGAGCTGRSNLPRFEKMTGRAVDGVLDGMEFGDPVRQLASLRWAQRCWQGGPRDMVLMVPMLIKGGNLAAGARGDYDQGFRDIAKILVEHGRGDAYLRIGHEFNGGWYPWAASRDPTAWKAYFRRIALIFKKTKGAKFTIVWNPAIGRQQIAPDLVYPGDDVVDVVAVDFYNAKISALDIDPDLRWMRYLAQPYGLNWLSSFAAAHKKSIAIPEWGTGHMRDRADKGGGDDPVFIHNVAQWIKAHDVLFHGYWDYPAKDYDGLLSTGDMPKSAAIFRESFGPITTPSAALPEAKANTDRP
jgi:hypothetical protein